MIIQLYRYGLPTAVMAAGLLLMEITPLFWLAHLPKFTRGDPG
ncbi:MAG: hypothetical protein QMD99_05500 [Rhizobiaceae bacterium]|nr:hypothetical protein [Rhizobiaceae bacterium]